MQTFVTYDCAARTVWSAEVGIKEAEAEAEVEAEAAGADAEADEAEDEEEESLFFPDTVIE